MENEREVEVLETGGPSAAQTQHHEEKRQSDDKDLSPNCGSKRQHEPPADDLIVIKKLASDDVNVLTEVTPKMCLHPELFVDDFVRLFSNAWTKEAQLEIELPNVRLYTEPFKMCVVREFLNNCAAVMDPLVREMTQLDWQRKQMDLYEFHQTDDLSNVTLTHLQAFYRNLRDNVLPWMQKLTGIQLTHVSASCSMYNMGDHLLVHDDMLSDRRIAFVYYVSPWTNVTEWTPQMGGELELFGADETGQPVYPVLRRIAPRNNQFVFFKVCHNSFHQVGEVTNMNYPRLTINGWFHCNTSVPNESTALKIALESFAEPNREPIDLSEWINEVYLEPATKRSVQQHIEENSEASLEMFLIEDYFDLLVAELKSSENDFVWLRQGPANCRHYETLKLDSAVGPIKDLLTVMSSKPMFRLLYEYTELDLSGDDAAAPVCAMTVCRLSNGSYSLLGNMDAFADSSLDVILYFNDKTNAGTITYLNPSEEHTDDQGNGGNSDAEDCDEDDNGDQNCEKKESILLTLYPKNNALNLVYRSEGTAKFIKYVSKTLLPDNEYVYILLASYKE